MSILTEKIGCERRLKENLSIDIGLPISSVILCGFLHKLFREMNLKVHQNPKEAYGVSLKGGSLISGSLKHDGLGFGIYVYQVDERVYEVYGFLECRPASTLLVSGQIVSADHLKDFLGKVLRRSREYWIEVTGSLR